MLNIVTYSKTRFPNVFAFYDIIRGDNWYTLTRWIRTHDVIY